MSPAAVPLPVTTTPPRAASALALSDPLSAAAVTGEAKGALWTETVLRECAAEVTRGALHIIEQRGCPVSTYRLQLRPERDFCYAALYAVPYLHACGISDAYMSPVLRPRPGSTYGYDVINPREINPELGGDEGLKLLTRQLRNAGMGAVMDVVPNHMEYGRTSEFADFFDIDWNPPDEATRGKVLVPVLGESLRDEIEHGNIALVYDQERQQFRVSYYNGAHIFPANLLSYPIILAGTRSAGEIEGLRSERLSAGATADSLAGLEAKCWEEDIARFRGELSRAGVSEEDSVKLVHICTEARAIAAAEEEMGSAQRLRERIFVREPLAELIAESDAVQANLKPWIIPFAEAPSKIRSLEPFAILSIIDLRIGTPPPRA
jgi:hypothetical protein